ncbi:MAG: HNH endonuclease [Bdellovibrionales bacterium]|nr:HNH endonuclease [Bdellovibrionales bacterium]
MNSGYEPVQIVSWQRAIILWLQGKVEVLEFHAESVQSPSHSFQLPSVLRLKQYIRPYITLGVRFSRQNVFVRDEFTCQYCRIRMNEKKLTLDHVIPLSKGGAHSWENVVAACSPCNNKKGDKTPQQAGFHLMKKPNRPNYLPTRDITHHRRQAIPDAWLIYLPQVAS